MNTILFGITSVIDTPNIPLSYSAVRSIFTRDERFEQTKRTISSIKEKIPEAKIIIIECSNYETNKEQLDYLRENSDYFLNLWDNQELHKYVFSIYKTIGAEIMTIELINYIINNNILFETFYCISGRYYLNDNFNLNLYYKNIIKFKDRNLYTSTRLYSLNKKYLILYKDYLSNNLNPNLSYEEIYGNFCDLYKNDVLDLNEDCVNGLIAINGLIAVSGDKCN
jgi:thymidylate synthase